MSTRRALVFSFLDRYAALVLSIGSSMVIARLLSPADIGVFSVTMVLVAFASTLRDMGAGQYLVQTRDLTAINIRATWTIMLSTGLCMALVVLAAAYPVSRFYSEPRMAIIMAIVALSFVINPLGSMTYAWLMREMRFETLAVMRLFSSLAGAFTAAMLAWHDHGPISLALGNLAATVVSAALGIWFRPPHFGWMPTLQGLRPALKFGGTTAGTSLLTDLANGAPELLLGRLQSLTAAGYFSRANGLAMMFQRMVMDATNVVALPTFAREFRSVGNIRAPFLRATAYVTALGWAFFIGLALAAYPTVRVLYGDQWDNSVDVVRVLAMGMCIGMPVAIVQPALLALGKPAVILRITLVLVPVQIAVIAIGAHFSLMGAAVGFALSQCLALVLWASAAQRELGFAWPQFGEALRRSALLAAAVSAAPLLALGAVHLAGIGHLPMLLVTAALGVVLFVLAARWVGHPIDEEIQRIKLRLRPAGGLP